jgi:hypothetical protein
MKTRIATNILLVALILAGCSNTQTPPRGSKEVLPGIYMSNDPADFPFPASGYTIYVAGELHGNQETKMVFQTYLQSLYKEAGLRDVILEEDQAYETDANAYVQGTTDKLLDGLCLRADILGQIREFNVSLPANEKVVVHLVDIDSPLPTIYKHITELHQQLGPAAAAIPVPDLSEFKAWVPQQRNKLVEELQKAATNQPDILNGLDTTYLSLRWYNLGNRMDTGMPIGRQRDSAPLREDLITQNIQYLLSQLNGKPVLAFFGITHGMKIVESPNPSIKDVKPWAQRLNEAGIKVYSLGIVGASGNGYWRGESFTYEVKRSQQYEGTDGYRFEDGITLVSFFENNPDHGIIYADLMIEDNKNIRLPLGYTNIPASQVYDGLIIFKEFTPMENACPQ